MSPSGHLPHGTWENPPGHGWSGEACQVLERGRWRQTVWVQIPLSFPSCVSLSQSLVSLSFPVGSPGKAAASP